ncbi:hypothetical protein [Alkalihalobacterium bogoriense]|nr:hypothetical protein [Alkalihalobacterium bogoriense]
MKVLVQGAIFSVIVHFVFVVSTLAYLQNEVAFGVTFHPIYFVVSFL